MNWIDPTFETQFENTRNFFGAGRKFQSHWETYCQLHHSFKPINLLENHWSEIVAEIHPDSKSTVFWLKQCLSLVVHGRRYFRASSARAASSRN